MDSRFIELNWVPKHAHSGSKLSDDFSIIMPCENLDYCLCTLSFSSYRQIIQAEGPAGPNRDYLFNLEKALLQIGEVL